MRVAVIGSDCSGKTGFIEELNKKLNYNIEKGSSFEHAECDNEELFSKFQHMAYDERNIIYDRFIYCNYVYATMYSDYSKLTADQRRYIEDLMRHDTVVVYLHADTEELVRRHGIRGDDYVTNDKFDDIKKYYQEVLMTCTLPMLILDSTNSSPKELAEMFMEKVSYINIENGGSL